MQAMAKGSHGAFPERGSRLWEPGEGGAWPGSLTQAGHTLLGSCDLGRGSFLAGAPGKKVQEALPAPCDSDTLTLPTPSPSSLRPYPGSPRLHPGCWGRRQKPQVRVQVPAWCCVTPASSWASLNGVNQPPSGWPGQDQRYDNCPGDPRPPAYSPPFGPSGPFLSLLLGA